MKKIVNGKIYDTEKSTLIGESSATDAHRGDFRYWEASLYQTPRSKSFFLAGEGGPMTRFAQSCGQNSWEGGSDLIPMTREQALEWAEANLKPAIVEHYFADVLEEA